MIWTIYIYRKIYLSLIFNSTDWLSRSQYIYLSQSNNPNAPVCPVARGGSYDRLPTKLRLFSIACSARWQRWLYGLTPILHMTGPNDLHCLQIIDDSSEGSLKVPVYMHRKVGFGIRLRRRSKSACEREALSEAKRGPLHHHRPPSVTWFVVYCAHSHFITW